MRTSLLLGREHGGDLKVIAGPGDPKEINALYKERVEKADLAELQLWTEHGGRQKRKFFQPGEAATKAPTTPPQNRIPVPTLQEVLDAGYDEEAAKKIVLKQSAMAEAYEKNPEISDDELEKAGRAALDAFIKEKKSSAPDGGDQNTPILKNASGASQPAESTPAESPAATEQAPLAGQLEAAEGPTLDLPPSEDPPKRGKR